MDVRKTVTDAGYIAIGLGVMGYQQTQTRRRGLTGKLECGARQARRARAARCRASSTEGSRQIGARGQAARGRAEEQVRSTVTRVQELGGEVVKIVEPVIDQVQAQLGDLPERVVQVIEPVAARVRELTGSAA